MHSSRIVIKTERQSKPLEFGEVRLTVNPQKSSSDFLVTPGREGTVTTYGRSTSREDSSRALPVNPEIKGQPSWVKSDNTRPLRPIQHGAGNTCSAVNKYTCQPTVTSQQSWKNKSNGQEPYKTSNYGLPPSKSFGTEHTTTYRNVPAHSSQFSNVGNTKSHTNAYSTPVSSVPKYHDGTRSYSPTGHGTRSAERTGSRLDLDPKLTQQNNHSRSPWQRPKESKMAEQKFIDDMVKAHNIYRATHQSGPIVHSPELSGVAQRWADHLAQRDKFEHSDAMHHGKHIGENIAMKWTSGPDNYTGQEATDQWYSEVKMYTFGREPSSSGTGHFTQVVWKGSDEIGVGKARTKDGKMLVVANYRPAGNMRGSYRENVLPPKDGKIALPVSREEPRSRPISTQSSAPFSSRFDKNSSSNMACKGGESRSVRTFTETSGSGASKVTKTVVEETITKADGSKCTNRKETITTGDSGSAPCDMKSIGHHDGKDKDKKGGAFGVENLNIQDDDLFKKKKRSGSSSSDSSPEREKKPQKIKDFIEDSVKTHNDLRKKHGVPPLKHAKDLSDFAQKWAEHLAATNSFQHSDCQHKGDRLGENIACKWSSSGADYSGKEVTDYWYSEIEKHDFSSEPRSLGSGHFTQVVWKGSKEMGIGKAKTSGGKVLVVGSYRPAGNMVGSFVANVPPPKK